MATKAAAQTKRATKIALPATAIKKAAAELGINDISRIPKEVVIVSSDEFGRLTNQKKGFSNIVVVVP